jgi:hypothetical protein
LKFELDFLNGVCPGALWPWIAVSNRIFHSAFFAQGSSDLVDLFYFITLHHMVLCRSVEHCRSKKWTVSSPENSPLCGNKNTAKVEMALWGGAPCITTTLEEIPLWKILLLKAIQS